MKKIEILALTINSLGFNANTRNRLMEVALKHKDREQYENLNKVPHPTENRLVWSRGAKRKNLEKWAGKLTVRDVISAYGEAWIGRRDMSTSLKKFIKKLVELGLNKTDWSMLPNHTLTDAASAVISKAEWLDRSIMFLGTLSSTALRDLEYKFDKHPSEITIRELIYSDNYDFRSGIKRSMEKTRKKLVELGCKYEDGSFMQKDTKRKIIESIMKREGLSKRDATLVVDVGSRTFWIPRPLYEG